MLLIYIEYIFIIRKLEDLNFINRYVMPVIVSLWALYLVYGAFIQQIQKCSCISH